MDINDLFLYTPELWQMGLINEPSPCVLPANICDIHHTITPEFLINAALLRQNNLPNWWWDEWNALPKESLDLDLRKIVTIRHYYEEVGRSPSLPSGIFDNGDTFTLKTALILGYFFNIEHGMKNICPNVRAVATAKKHAQGLLTDFGSVSIRKDPWDYTDFIGLTSDNLHEPFNNELCEKTVALFVALANAMNDCSKKEYNNTTQWYLGQKDKKHIYLPIGLLYKTLSYDVEISDELPLL